MEGGDYGDCDDAFLFANLQSANPQSANLQPVNFPFANSPSARNGSPLVDAQSSPLPRQRTSFRKLSGLKLSGLAAVAAGLAALAYSGTVPSAQAQEVDNIEARVVAVDIPGASAVAQVGTFLNAVKQGACSAPIPTLFPSFIQPGAVLDPIRLLVGSRSNFGAPPAIGVGAEGSLLSIDPTGSTC